MKHRYKSALRLTQYGLGICLICLGCRSPGVSTEATVPDVSMEMMSDAGRSRNDQDSALPMNGNYTIQPPVLPRLTATQYINTVEDIFGENRNLTRVGYQS